MYVLKLSELVKLEFNYICTGGTDFSAIPDIIKQIEALEDLVEKLVPVLENPIDDK